VIDDDVVVPMLFSMGLEDIEILEASRSSEGARLAEAHHPDAVIVDRSLPDGDGLDLVRTLRAAPATRGVPIILLTAGHDEADRSEVLRAGADDYLAKPIDPAQLESLVRDLLAVGPDDLRSRRERTARSLPLRAGEQEASPPS
jgi:DNA-binding response OmpR family regulator